MTVVTGDVNEPRQLTLGLHLEDDATFENFYIAPGAANALPMAALQAQLGAGGEPTIFLWGAPGTGVSHLLQAACHQAELSGASAQYLPLAALQSAAPSEILQHLDSLDLVCVDELQRVAGDLVWEQELFHFINAMGDAGKRVLLGSDNNPRLLPLLLPDLQSRFNWGLVFQLQPLGDDDKRRALQSRAANLGLKMSAEVARFMLYRGPRDTRQLFACLRRLDQASLEHQHHLTIPFVKRVLML